MDFVASLPDDVEVVTGGAHGVDQLAEQCARMRGLNVIVLPAAWHLHGRRAGIIRNAEIVARSTKLVAFWDGESRGTADAIAQATKAGLPVVVVRSLRDELPTQEWLTW